MELKLVNGDYVPDGAGGLCRLSGAEEVLGRVEEAVRGWFNGRLLGQRILRARLGEIIYHCEGVANYSITTPAADVAVREDQLPLLGTLRVEAKV